MPESSIFYCLVLMLTVTNVYSLLFMERSIITSLEKNMHYPKSLNRHIYSKVMKSVTPIRSVKLNCAIHEESSNSIYNPAIVNPAIVNSSSSQHWLSNLLEKITLFFPIWVLVFSLLGFKFPSLFLWFSPLITPALALTMTSMGMTLSYSDFSQLLPNWRFILLGFVAQYSVMPLSAYYISKFIGLSSDLATGLILVGCAPGGTASNLVTLIAKGDLALSIMMTTASTLAAVFMTPFLISKLAGSLLVAKSVQSSDLVLSTMNVVLLPVLIGLLTNTYRPDICSAVSRYTPSLSVLLVAMICGCVSASNSAIGKSMNLFSGGVGLKLLAAIALLHSVGFLFGYLMARISGAGEQRARTISIETGMQNSALAVVLSRHFPHPDLTALPGALSATCHSVIGSLLASFWRRSRPPPSQPLQE